MSTMEVGGEMEGQIDALLFRQLTPRLSLIFVEVEEIFIIGGTISFTGSEVN